MNFFFTRPQFLLLLFLIPLFFVIYFFSLSNRKKIALKFANFDAIAKIQGIDFFSKNILIFSLNLLIIFLMIFAVCGLGVQVLKKSSSFSFVIAIDVSESMLATDLDPNRITIAKQTALDFVDASLLGARIGVISFSGSSYVEQEITSDRSIIKNVINKVVVEGYGGTDFYEALIASKNLLEDEEHKAVILLSDGQINVGLIDEIIDYANKNDIIIHTIALGTKEGGRTPFALSKLDEDTLNGIAYNTRGKYFLAESGEALSQAFLEILDLTKKKVSLDLVKYLILAAIFLFVINFFLINTRYFNIL